jgi:hypothetical protein
LKKVAKFLEVVADGKRSAAKSVRERLFGSCRKAVQDAGHELAGYALVTWTRDGDIHSAYDTRFGPIRSALVPTLIADALNRHVAVTLATQERIEDEIS